MILVIGGVLLTYMQCYWKQRLTVELFIAKQKLKKEEEVLKNILEVDENPVIIFAKIDPDSRDK